MSAVVFQEPGVLFQLPAPAVEYWYCRTAMPEPESLVVEASDTVPPTFAPGLDMVAAVGRLETRAGVALKARVGIATGTVVVGDLVGEGVAQEQSVIGETPNLAARLQAMAEPGTVVVSASTRRLLGDIFGLRDQGEHELKGLS